MASKNKVLIAGGGIGGITALLALRQRGIAAELFEQAAAFGQVGAGIQVSCNATRVLRTLGLGDALARVAYYPEGRDYRAWDNGDRLYYTPLGKRAEAHFGAPYYTAHRADLLDVLLGGLGTPSIGSASADRNSRHGNPGWLQAASRMRWPSMPVGTTPSAPSLRRRRACSDRRYMTASLCLIGGSDGSSCWAMPPIP